MSYDANSTDAMFSRIMEKLTNTDLDTLAHRKEVREELAYIRTAVDKTNGRVTRLERDQWKQRGAVAAITVMILFLGWLVPLLWPILHY